MKMVEGAEHFIAIQGSSCRFAENGHEMVDEPLTERGELNDRGVVVEWGFPIQKQFRQARAGSGEHRSESCPVPFHSGLQHGCEEHVVIASGQLLHIVQQQDRRPACLGGAFQQIAKVQDQADRRFTRPGTVDLRHASRPGSRKGCPELQLRRRFRGRRANPVRQFAQLMPLVKSVQQHRQRAERRPRERCVDYAMSPRLGVRRQVPNQEFGLARPARSEEAHRLWWVES